MSEALNAIRNDPIIGKGSCSVVDECWDDDMVLKATEGMTPADALDAFHIIHEVFEDVLADHLGEVF
jgi:hypothetical protein